MRHLTRLRRPRPGLLAALLLFFGPSFFGDTPDTRDTTAKVAGYFVEHRTSVFVGVVVTGLALVALLVRAGGIATVLRHAGRDTVATVVQSAAAVAAAVVTVAMLVVYAALSYVIGSDVPDMAKGLFELTLVTAPVVALPVATLMLATAYGVTKTALAPRWFVVLSAVLGVALALAAGGFAARGPFSPDVEQQMVFGFLTIWLIASDAGLRSLTPTPTPAAAQPADDQLT